MDDARKARLERIRQKRKEREERILNTYQQENAGKNFMNYSFNNNEKTIEEKTHENEAKETAKQAKEEISLIKNEEDNKQAKEEMSLIRNEEDNKQAKEEISLIKNEEDNKQAKEEMPLIRNEEDNKQAKEEISFIKNEEDNKQEKEKITLNRNEILDDGIKNKRNPKSCSDIYKSKSSASWTETIDKLNNQKEKEKISVKSLIIRLFLIGISFLLGINPIPFGLLLIIFMNMLVFYIFEKRNGIIELYRLVKACFSWINICILTTILTSIFVNVIFNKNKNIGPL